MYEAIKRDEVVKDRNMKFELAVRGQRCIIERPRADDD